MTGHDGQVDRVRRALALHEAGHATCAWALGWPLAYCMLDVDRGGTRVCGQEQLIPAFELAVIVAGGPAADAAWGWGRRPGGDEAKLAVLQPGPGRRLVAEATATCILAAHRRRHGLLAVALDRAGYLDGDGVAWWLERDPVR